MSKQPDQVRRTRDGRWELVDLPKVTATSLITVMRRVSGQDPELDKRALADFLRRLWSAAAAFGYGGPVVVITTARGENQGEDAGLFEAWAADQEWHRGEFAVFVAADETTAHRLAAELTSPLAPVPEDSRDFDKHETEARFAEAVQARFAQTAASATPTSRDSTAGRIVAFVMSPNPLDFLDQERLGSQDSGADVSSAARVVASLRLLGNRLVAEAARTEREATSTPRWPEEAAQ